MDLLKSVMKTEQLQKFWWCGKTVEQIEAEYSGFAAWNALKDYMPSEFQPDVDESSLNLILMTGATLSSLMALEL